MRLNPNYFAALHELAPNTYTLYPRSVWIERLADRLSRQRTPEGRVRAWWRWPLILALIAVGVLAAAWILRRDRRELARLRHERYQREQEARSAALDAQLAETEQAAEAALERVRAATAALDAVETRLTAAQETYARTDAAIDRIRWADLPRADSSR